jgi:hypothetical protein
MQFLNKTEAIEWSKVHKITLNERGSPARDAPDGFHKARFEIEKEASKSFRFCRLIEHSLQPWTRCLFWVTEWGIWESSENWHLYYRLRQSYGDHQLLEEAPAHLFLEHESHDLISFLQIGLAAGWDISLLSHEGYSHVFISHDEWVEFVMQDKTELDKIGAELGKSRGLLK